MNEKIKTDAEQHDEAFDEKFQNSTLPDAMKELYQWYMSNKEHRGLLIMQMDEETHNIEGMMLGKRRVLEEGLASHFTKDQQMVDVLHSAILASMRIMLSEIIELLEKPNDK